MAVSDPKGKLELRISDENKLSNYRQGTGQADNYVCNCSGVCVAIIYAKKDSLFAALNARSFERFAEFAKPTKISPKELGGKEKRERWLLLWTPVSIFIGPRT